MKPAISVICTTRQRVPLLQNMLQSLRETALRPEAVEVVLRCDFDDKDTIDFLRTQDCLFIVGPRRNGYATLASLVNEAARLSHADLAIVVNDDVEFVTQGWDTRLVQIANAFQDGIFNLGVRTELNDANFVFPCTSRRVIDLIGIHDERVMYSDIWLRDVMQAFDRAVPVTDVTIRHNWTGMTPDQAHAFQRKESHTTYLACVDEGIQTIRRALA